MRQAKIVPRDSIIRLELQRFLATPDGLVEVALVVMRQAKVVPCYTIPQVLLDSPRPSRYLVIVAWYARSRYARRWSILALPPLILRARHARCTG